MTLDARKIGFNILLGLAFYLPLEDFLLRWLPLPLSLLVAIRQVPEVLVWLVALGAAALHLANHGSIRVIGRRIDRFLLGFIVVAIATIFLNGADAIEAAISLKALLRYIPLIYALIMLAPNDLQLKRIPRVIVVAFGVQAAVGIAEWIGGQPARSFFSVIHAWGGYTFSTASLSAIQTWEMHDLTGTMPRPIAYGYFILVGLVVWIVQNEKHPLRYGAGVALALLLTFLSHSRMAVFGAILVVVMHQVAIRGVRKTVWLTTLLLPLVAAVSLSMGSALADNFYILDVFSGEYWEHALTYNRLGLIVYILPYVFDGGISLLGYSSDIGIVAAAVTEHFRLPDVITFIFVQIMEDVYWLALLLYYGFVGFTCFVLFFGKLTALVIRLYRRATDGSAKRYALIAALLLVLAIPLNGINQTFEIRQFAYYLWLFVGVAIVGARNAMPTSESA